LVIVNLVYDSMAFKANAKQVRAFWQAFGLYRPRIIHQRRHPRQDAAAVRPRCVAADFIRKALNISGEK
jgi:hypothetical protein